MIPTEQNKQNTPAESIQETQTFTVQPHTAQSLRNRLNQAEAQARQRNNGEPKRPSTPTGRDIAVPGSRSVQSVQKTPQLSREHDGRMPARTSRPVQNASVTPPERRISRTVNQSSQQQGRSLPREEARQGLQPSAQPTARSSQTPVQHSVRDENPRQPRPVQMPRNPQPKPAVTQSAGAVSDMTRTRQVAPVKSVSQKQEYTGSDEGGNTVVSVVKAIVYIVFVMIVSVFLALVIINVGNDMFAFVKSDELVEVSIPDYATLDQVTEVLYQNDIIRYPTIFKLFAVAEEDDRKFVAGNYTVHGMMNYEDLLDAFKEKPVTGIKKITIPEGYTTDEIIDLFVSEGIGTREGFVDVIQNYEFDYWFIDELNANGLHEDRIYRLDGYLFPDTYEFYLSSSEATVIDKLLKRFTQIFNKQYREQSAAFGYTVDEVITLASIIEKEAASPSEFFIISSVFHNRLNNPWTFPKLESDATIVYQMQHESGERPQLTGSDLEVDLAYNTYTNDGLPPGPIANPSASAMLAALLPVSTNYYFFYHHKGTIYPSATKAEHDAIVAQFQTYTEEQTTGDLVTE